MGCAASLPEHIPTPDEALADLAQNETMADSIRSYYQEFRNLDADKDGYLTKEDAITGKVPLLMFQLIVRSAALNFDRTIEDEANQRINFTEYALLKLANEYPEVQRVQRKLRAAKWFHEFDIDNNQVLDFQEVRLAIRAARIGLSDYELQQTMEYIINLPEHAKFHNTRSKRKDQRVLNIVEFTNLILHALEANDKKEAAEKVGMKDTNNGNDAVNAPLTTTTTTTGTTVRAPMPMVAIPTMDTASEGNDEASKE